MERIFLDTLSPDDIPPVRHAQGRSPGLERWSETVDRLEDGETADLVRRLADHEAGRRLLELLFSSSDFLTQCVLSDMGSFAELLSAGPAIVLGQEMDRLKGELSREADGEAVMAGLRRARRRIALAVAVADIAGCWTLEQVTGALTDFADAAISAALSHLILRGKERGDLEPADPAEPERDCGLAVLAMGKLGAGELNYSSDIDLIVIYDPEVVPYRGTRGLAEFLVRLTRDLVTILEQRTGDGYVFRVDLRLRPDPAAMPLAISYNAAMTYYESMGQNWERAAMIKARPAAGDRPLGRAFLDELRPFVWRKHLDFWAIQDVHSIKRQIHSHKGGGAIALAGHNIKLGRGGIREIEFFVQTQQLIYGGRDPHLRSPRTLEALGNLAAAGRIDPQTAEGLSDSYRFLRTLEHRLQMVDDQQTQTLPAAGEAYDRLAAFMGYDRPAFDAELLRHLKRVEAAYAALFEQAPALSGTGSLVFTGGEPEAETVRTLEAMGFGDPATVFKTVRAWHHGRYRATRSTRAREILTEIMPSLLAALGKTAGPDRALAKFDDFLAGLPAGVQLFALLQANPRLLDLLAQIMGGAPALADHLSRRPGLLDAVIGLDFFEPTPDAAELGAELAEALSEARDFQDVLDLTRRWANDRRFQIGTQILRHTADLDETSGALSDVACCVIRALARPVLEDFARLHGRVAGPGLAVLALGKLGGREMTVTSDLDLIFVYRAEEGAEASDGPKPLPVSQYFARLAQRFINALTALTPEGQLYEIDMRLRPSGKAGPIAVSLEGFHKYHETSAWTWEHMALTRARVVAGDPALARDIEETVRRTLTAARDPDALLRDVAEMRARIEREFKAASPWQVKYLRGGLVDLDFLAQYLLLRHAPEHPSLLDPSTEGAFRKLEQAGLLPSGLGTRLIEANRLMRRIQGFLRLTVEGAFEPAAAPGDLEQALAQAAGCADFPALEEALHEQAGVAYEAFREIIEEPARALEDGGAADSSETNQE